MGMDVYGRDNPEAYFRRNVWGWRPLWDACQTFAPDLTAKVEYGHSNDGDGLNAEDSLALAAILDEAVESGDAHAYVEQREAWLDSLPDHECKYCKGTGVRRDAVGIENNMPERNYCNGCDSTGRMKDWETCYFLTVDDFTEFSAFLKECGGFSIC